MFKYAVKDFISYLLITCQEKIFLVSATPKLVWLLLNGSRFQFYFLEVVEPELSRRLLERIPWGRDICKHVKVILYIGISTYDGGRGGCNFSRSNTETSFRPD